MLVARKRAPSRMAVAAAASAAKVELEAAPHDHGRGMLLWRDDDDRPGLQRPPAGLRPRSRRPARPVRAGRRPPGRTSPAQPSSTSMPVRRQHGRVLGESGTRVVGDKGDGLAGVVQAPDRFGRTGDGRTRQPHDAVEIEDPEHSGSLLPRRGATTMEACPASNPSPVSGTRGPTWGHSTTWSARPTTSSPSPSGPPCWHGARPTSSGWSCPATTSGPGTATSGPPPCSTPGGTAESCTATRCLPSTATGCASRTRRAPPATPSASSAPWNWNPPALASCRTSRPRRRPRRTGSSCCGLPGPTCHPSGD